jgi:transcriptional regulator with PAS, ATPase and Fis domain
MIVFAFGIRWVVCMPHRIRISIFCPESTHRRRIEAILLSGGFAVLPEDVPDLDLALFVLGPSDAETAAGYRSQIEGSRARNKVLVFSALPLHGLGNDELISGQAAIADACNPATLIPRIRARFSAKGKTVPEIQELVGDSAAMRAIREQIRMFAPSDATVLVTGETGTGKECAARMVHRLSHRARGPFIAVNCAAIPDALLEGELFGYERGAFTGAIKAFPGKLKIADAGTLVLDEVGDLTLAAQAKILRAIESREIYRLGASSPDRFDARIVAVTNVDLATRMRDLGFRKDLYFRLAVACICIPPLRERREDIGALAQHFLSKLGMKSNSIAEGFDSHAIEILGRHNWLGNARELCNSVEVALLSCKGPVIMAADLPPYLSAGNRSTVSLGGIPVNDRDRIVQTLAACGGNKSMAAKSLKWSRMTLYRKLELYGLHQPNSVTSHVTM